jgi:hypothetical protein
MWLVQGNLVLIIFACHLAIFVVTESELGGWHFHGAIGALGLPSEMRHISVLYLVS